MTTLEEAQADILNEVKQLEPTAGAENLPVPGQDGLLYTGAFVEAQVKFLHTDPRTSCHVCGTFFRQLMPEIIFASHKLEYANLIRSHRVSCPTQFLDNPTLRICSSAGLESESAISQQIFRRWMTAQNFRTLNGLNPPQRDATQSIRTAEHIRIREASRQGLKDMLTSKEFLDWIRMRPEMKPQASDGTFPRFPDSPPGAKKLNPPGPPPGGPPPPGPPPGPGGPPPGPGGAPPPGPGGAPPPGPGGAPPPGPGGAPPPGPAGPPPAGPPPGPGGAPPPGPGGPPPAGPPPGPVVGVPVVPVVPPVEPLGKVVGKPGDPAPLAPPKSPVANALQKANSLLKTPAKTPVKAQVWPPVITYCPRCLNLVGLKLEIEPQHRKMCNLGEHIWFVPKETIDMKKGNATLSLYDFYYGIGLDKSRRGLLEILAWDNKLWEEKHDYIQWLYPLYKPSTFLKDSPVLTDGIRYKMVKSQVVQGYIDDVVARTLNFLGFQKLNDFSLIRLEEFTKNTSAYKWTLKVDHNHLRITRIIESLRLLGRDNDAQSIYTAVKEYFDGRDEKDRPSNKTLTLWNKAATAKVRPLVEPRVAPVAGAAGEGMKAVVLETPVKAVDAAAILQVNYYLHSDEQVDADNRTLSQILAMSDKGLDKAQNWLPWVFPLPGPSNPGSKVPTITGHTIMAFRTRPILGERLYGSFKRMVKYYGYELNPGHTMMTPRQDIDFYHQKWLEPKSRHHKRIRRIIRSLRFLGQHHAAMVFFRGIESTIRKLWEAGAGDELLDSMSTWTEAAQGNLFLPQEGQPLSSPIEHIIAFEESVMEEEKLRHRQEIDEFIKKSRESKKRKAIQAQPDTLSVNPDSDKNVHDDGDSLDETRNTPRKRSKIDKAIYSTAKPEGYQFLSTGDKYVSLDTGSEYEDGRLAYQEVDESDVEDEVIDAFDCTMEISCDEELAAEDDIIESAVEELEGLEEEDDSDDEEEEEEEEVAVAVAVDATIAVEAKDKDKKIESEIEVEDKEAESEEDEEDESEEDEDENEVEEEYGEYEEEEEGGTTDSSSEISEDDSEKYKPDASLDFDFDKPGIASNPVIILDEINEASVAVTPSVSETGFIMDDVEEDSPFVETIPENDPFSVKRALNSGRPAHYGRRKREKGFLKSVSNPVSQVVVDSLLESNPEQELDCTPTPRIGLLEKIVPGNPRSRKQLERAMMEMKKAVYST